ncbi:nitrous oxide reductase family maturation protein NosD [Natronolimnobius baerhuensis]|uniref:Copper-binding protein n=1 Tax=Natronolimnobius baerhuensis TaxID=253108 RepID=A0A202E6F1_9EURY|nr:nitrous oxide reductase family maturation protein NosD [Natronolimnobius baerhuensis]OVE83825.1 copper-binding protein [Natronolimnobius baerhuensis]
MTDRESWLLVAAVAVLLVALGAAVVAADGPASGTADATIEGWTPDVDDPRDVTAPDESGVATLEDQAYDSVQAAVDDAEPGDTITLEGRFDEHVTVETSDLTLEAADSAVGSETGTEAALLDGSGEGTVLEITAANVTVDGLWVRESGPDRSTEDAGIYVNGSDATLSDVRITESTFGIWITEATNVTVEDAAIAGREEIGESQRGNGIHLDRADGAQLLDNEITTVRDGIYFSWSEDVRADGNHLWDLRYGVHYMYSDHNHLEGNVAFDNDVGFALMVSQDLTIVDNVVVNNDGPSGQGILVKDVDNSEIRDNAVVANRNGLYVYNAHGNEIIDNLVLENGVGIHFTAGSTDERVVGNSVIENGEQAYASTTSQLAWNDTDGGNYWSDARASDLDGDGTSAVRHQPAGTVEQLVREQPQAAVFAESPAFDAVRMAESSFPILESPGVVDHRPLAEPPHDNWREYYADHDY